MEDHGSTVVVPVWGHSGCIDVAALVTVDSHTVDTGGDRGPAMAGSCRAQRWAAPEA